MRSLRSFLGIRNRKPRVLLVPDQWSGSVQEYYHFLLGYLAPIALWIHHHPGVQVAVRDCGPMNSWLELLPGGTDLSIMSPGDMLHMYAGKYHQATVLRGDDDPQAFDARRLQQFRELMLSWNSVSLSTPPDRMTVIDRRSSGEFNASAAAEVPASGAAVRSTPNLTAILESKSFPVDTHILDAAHIAPGDQLATFAATRVLVAQHGAGLANMIWMPRGGKVIEILPPVPGYVEPIFANLAAACGHGHRVVRQESDHAPVSEVDLLAAIDSSCSGHQ